MRAQHASQSQMKYQYMCIYLVPTACYTARYKGTSAIFVYMHTVVCRDSVEL